MKSQNPIALDQNTNVIPIHFGKATIPTHLKNMLIQGDRNGVRLVFALSFPCEDAVILESTKAEIFALLPNGDELKKELPIFQNQNSVYASWLIDEDFTKYAGTLSPQLNIYMGESIFKQIKMDSLDIEKPLSSKDFIVSEYPNVLQNLLDDLKITKQNLAENYYTKKEIDDFNFGSGGSGGSGANGKDGKSAYEIWISLGNIGTEQDFISSLVGANGADGTDGKSAYEIWIELGNIGTQQDFISSLIGADGVDGIDGVDGTDGVDGKSAYETWLSLGNIGSEQDFINSLKCTQENPLDPNLFYTKEETQQHLKVVENKITNANLLINGDFKIWQRGKMFEGAFQKYTADRWFGWTEDAADKIMPSKTLLNGIKLERPTGSNIGRILYKYPTEDLQFLFDKNLTLSFEIMNTIDVNVYLQQDHSQSLLLDIQKSSSKLKQATFTLKKGINKFEILIQSKNQAGYFEIANVKLEAGENATSFVAKSYAEELALCQRYYSLHNITSPIMASNPNSKGTYHWMVAVNKTYPTTMRVLPTIKLLNPFTIAGVGAGISPSTYVGCYQSIEGMNYLEIEQPTVANTHNYVNALQFQADAEIYN